MQLNRSGEFEATARIYKKNHQWVIRIEELPEWLVETMKDEMGSGFGEASKENEVDHSRVLVLEGRYYPG